MVFPIAGEIFKSGFTLLKNWMFIFSNPEKTERMMSNAQVAIVMANTAMEVMMFTPVTFLLANTDESKLKISDNNPVEIKTSDNISSPTDFDSDPNMIIPAPESESNARIKAINNFDR